MTPTPVVVATRALVVTLMVVSTTCVWARGDDFSRRDRQFVRLTTSLTTIQDGKPFREALQTIADQVELNLWLDRRVDPSLPVAAGPVGPTVAAAIKKIAQSRDLVVMPVAGVLLVGRRGWVDSTAATLLSLETDEPQANRIGTVTWEILTTPQEALRQATGDATTKVDPPLPHDLWPAVRLQQVDRRVAVALVLSQFDRRPQSSESLVNLTTVPATSSGQFSRRYLVGPFTAELKQTILRIDRAATLRVDQGWIVAQASIAAHRAAVNAVLVQQAAKLAENPTQDQRFSLNPTRASAGSLLTSFAKTAGRKCQISPEAMEACQQIIEIEADEQTLRELVQRVATEVGVQARWEAGAIVVSSLPPTSHRSP